MAALGPGYRWVSLARSPSVVIHENKNMNKLLLHARRILAIAALIGAAVGTLGGRTATGAEERRLLYVAAPGIRDYLEYGGHGLLVFDIDDGHRFVKRIPTAGLDERRQAAQREGRLRQRGHEADLHQHHEDAHLPRPRDREGPLGAGLSGRVRPDGDLARRQGDLPPLVREATTGTSSTPSTAT